MNPFPLWAYPLVFLVSGALSTLLTPLALQVAVRYGILDHPGPAKSHSKAVPYLGGAAIALSFVAAVLVATAVHPPSSGFPDLALIMAMAVVLVVLGLLDDLERAPVWLRLLVEAGAGAVMWSIGVSVHLAGVSGPFDALLTVAFVLLVTNAFNLLDNMDGLSAGIAAITALGLFGIALDAGEFLVAGLSVALAGCAAGFLRHNFHPAKIYMGDAGSLFLGFLLAVLALKLRDTPAHAAPIAGIGAVLFVALFDTALVMVTRMIRGVSPFSGGTDHTSHRLVALGLPVRAAVLLIYIVAAGMSGVGVVFSRHDHTFHTWGVVSLVVVAVAAGVAAGKVDPARRKR